jgi:hypothetical protein
MANKYWQKQEKIFLIAIKDVEIPNKTLKKVDNLLVKRSVDLNAIPSGGGCYWIWTNEPIKHSLHKHKTPDIFDNGEVIYNGIAKDNVKDRIFHHLFGSEDAGWSGISLDIYTKNSRSHRKKACSPSGKVPYLDKKPIRNKKQLLQLHLSKKERDYISKKRSRIFYFRNGIDIRNNKHKNYDFKVFFITGLTCLYLEYIEKKWREIGLPKLCSYSSGR